MAEYNLPEDVDEAFLKEADERALASGDPVELMMYKIMGEKGKHVYAAGSWLSWKLECAGAPSETRSSLCFKAGQLALFEPDPWDISQRLYKEYLETHKEDSE